MEQKRDKSKLVIGAVLLVIGGALLAWSLTGRGNGDQTVESNSDKSSSAVKNDDSSSNQDPNTPVSSDNTEIATITFTDDGFSPEELEVKLGQIVAVKNQSNQRVQFSSDDHPTHRLNEGMNLKVLAPGESGTFTAGPVGRHGFHDHIDDSFTGVLIVRE